MSQIIAYPGLDTNGADPNAILAMNKTLYVAEIQAAFHRHAVTKGRHLNRELVGAKSAKFPVSGRKIAQYLKPGKSLDDQRKDTEQTEIEVFLDGLLTVDDMVTDILTMMSHVDYRAEYVDQQAQALALSFDGSMFAEMAKLAAAKTENLVGLGKSDVLEGILATGDYGVTEAMGLKIFGMLGEIATKMDNNYVPQTERILYIKPEGHRALTRSLVAIDRNYGATGSIIEGNVLKLLNFDIIPVPHLTIGGADAANVLQGDGHVFPAAYVDTAMMIATHRRAIASVTMKDITVETGRRIEYQATQLVSSCSFGCKGMRPEATFMGIITKN